MKKHGLFKTILIILGLLVVFSYFIPGREGVTSIIALGDIGINFAQSFYYFFDTIVFLLVLGAFYGVLNETSAYKKLLDNITSKVKDHGKLFVFITTLIFAVLTSITGLINPLLVFVPMIISIILLLGYDKLVAISSTIVAMLVGFIGGIFITFRDPNNYYGYSSTTFEGLAGVDSYTNLLPQLILLILGVALLIFFINRYMKNVADKKVKYELNNDSEVLVSEVKSDYKSVRTWPLILIFSLIFIILLLGFIPWNSLFGIEVFDKFHTWLTGLTIPEFSILGLKFKEYPVFNSLISNNLYAFGNFAYLGSFMSIIVTLIVFCLIIKLVYKVKFNSVIDGFVEGAKKMIPASMLMALAYAVLVCTYNNGFISTIITASAESSLGLNVVTASLVTAIGSLLHTDLYYAAAGVFSPILAAVTDESLSSVFAMTFQSIYGLVSIIGPTSFLLVTILSYFDVPYTTWVKYIWRFVLMLFLLIILVLLVMTLI